jgi:hypothetical protein
MAGASFRSISVIHVSTFTPIEEDASTEAALIVPDIANADE